MHSTLYLGIDYGTKRIGLAIGQTLTNSATPLKTIHVNTQTLWEQFLNIIQEWQPKGIVVGLALQEDGSTSSLSEQASQFGRHLAKRFHLPVYFAEERLTSVAAREYLRNNPKLSKQHNKDSLAAAIILESWLHSETKEISRDAFKQSSI